MGLSIAKFPFVRTLEGFDDEAQPAVDAAQLRELATGGWLANGDALLVLGPPGVGKTHLAVASGHEAIVRGDSVLFTTATALMTALSQAHAQGRLGARGWATTPSPSCSPSTSSALCPWRRMPRTCSSSSSPGVTSAAA
jgi:DNA replication protein DnaC